MKPSTRITSRIGGALFALLFVLAFGAGGAFGLASLWKQVSGPLAARSWVAVQATVIDAQLDESSGDDSTTYEAIARFRYEYHGVPYEGTRVGFSSGHDNIGAWQHDHYRDLTLAQSTGRAIEVWVDPGNPASAVVDRRMRWAMVGFFVPFATLFPAVSLAALWMLIRILRSPEGVFTARSPKANAGAIRSNARSEVRTLWGFAAFWNLIAFPLAFVLFANDAPWWAKLLIAIFPLVGLAIVYGAISRTLQVQRHGEVTLALDPQQPAIGDTLRVHASFELEPPSGAFSIALVCENVDSRGEDTTETVLWREERQVHASGAGAFAAFTPPATLPASEPHTGVYNRWRALLKFPDSKDERAFEVVLTAARDGSVAAMVVPDSGGLDLAVVAAQPLPESVATVVSTGSTLDIRYPPTRHRGLLMVSLVFACGFGGVGAFMLLGNRASAVASVMGLLFGAVGVGLLLAGVYSITHRRRVVVADGHLRVDTHWLFGAKHESVSVSDILKLQPRISSTSRVGTRTTEHHQIRAYLRDGGRLVLASDLRDAGVVRTLIDLIGRQLSSHVPDVPVLLELDRVRLEATPANAVIVKRIKLGVQLVGGLLLLAFLWDVFEPFAPSRAGNDTELEVER